MTEKTQMLWRCRFKRRQACNLQLGVAMQVAPERIDNGA